MNAKLGKLFQSRIPPPFHPSHWIQSVFHSDAAVAVVILSPLWQFIAPSRHVTCVRRNPPCGCSLWGACLLSGKLWGLHPIWYSLIIGTGDVVASPRPQSSILWVKGTDGFFYSIRWVCFSNPPIGHLYDAIVVSLQSETLPSHFRRLQINRTGILGFADVCRGAIVFFNSCMSLPVPAPVFTAERCFLSHPAGPRCSPSTIRSGAGLRSVPQERPGGTADNLEARSRAWTRSNTRVLWNWLESSRNIWCVRFKLGYSQMDIRVV